MSIHNRVSVTFRLIRPCLLAVVVLSTIWVHRWMPASAGEPVSGVEEFAWRETPASLALLRGQRVVWQFNHLQDGSERGVPYFHPLATLDGAVLTDLRPDDHLWHRGLRFAWKQINGLDGYWTWPEGLELYPEATGQTEVTAVRMTKGKDFSARFELELSYHPPGQPADLTEKRTILVSAPDAQGRYQIDWQGVFTAGARGAVLDRTPIPGQPDGKPWGGYAGLQLRLPQRENLAAWGLLNSEKLAATSSPETVDKGKAPSLQDLHGQAARWLEVSVELVDGKKGAVALLGHPGNLRHPAAWHVSSMPHELIQTPLFHAPHTLAAGESLTFTYRVLVSSARSEAGFLDQQWQDFAGYTSAPFIETERKSD